MSRKTVKRGRLFSTGVDALRRIQATEQDLYCCPLCLCLLSESDLEKGELTLEHVPTRTLCGEEILLTCRSCNSRAGHNFEFQLVNRYNLSNFGLALLGKGEFSGRVRLEMSGTETNVDATIGDGKLNVNMPEAINNPPLLQSQFDHL